MKQQRLLLGLGLVGICILVCWLFFSRPSESARKVQQQKAKQATKAPQPTSASQGATTNALTKLKSKGEKMREGLSLLNHQPIEFYGKAVDQNGEPLTDATVTGHVQINDGHRTTSENHATTTDENGLFQFNGFSGRSMGIRIDKSGYEQDLRGGNSFDYSLMFREKVHHPDPSNPVIFKMWKLAGAEGMVERMIDSRILCDGTPITFNLLAGKQVSEDGDVRVSLVRTPFQIQRGKDKFNYTLKVEMLNGGLNEHQDVFPYLAPEDDYVGSTTYQVLASDPNWSSSLVRPVYLQLRGGKMYARGKIDLMADSERPEGTSFRIYTYINPSGSRNLEYDPDKRISPERIAQIGLEKAIEEASQSRKSSGLNDKLEMTNDK